MPAKRVFREVLETCVRPGAVMRRKLARGVSERQLLGYLMGALLVSYGARLPAVLALGRAAPADAPSNAPPEALAGAMLIAMLLFAPLLLYALAAISHLVAHMVGGRGSGQAARLALFWPLLVAQPFVIAIFIEGSLLNGGPPAKGLSLALMLWFLWLWLTSLVVAERDGEKIEKA